VGELIAMSSNYGHSTELFETRRAVRRDQTNYRFYSTDRLLVTIKQMCREYERLNLLRNHAAAMATLRRIVRLGEIVEERTS
jgi:hypothetical protein